ncbi:hypothetical protein KSP39_PZI004155 [Platanthera zijinensis]|uniref:tRNA:m(4)X modification enzyme TRM13 n=1 Tax=Platanthera zijinensis TaxID=2320716 RepID=A0AAP0BWW0_9ASPA
MVSNSSSHVAGDEAGGEANGVVKYLKEKHCQFWLPNKRRHCANSPLPFSPFCGNHDSSASDHRLPCPLDPSHSVSKENLGSHLKKCPSRTQALALEAQTYYSKGINCDFIDSPIDEISSDAKRAAIYALNLSEFLALVKKIDCLHYAIVGDLENSYLIPDACDKWFSRPINSKIPYQERHVLQQASILGNMENFGILHRPEELVNRGDKEGNVDVFVQERGKLPAVVEFGAGRGYLTHMLADSYGIKKIFLVERRAYKLKVAGGAVTDAKANSKTRKKNPQNIDKSVVAMTTCRFTSLESFHEGRYWFIWICRPLLSHSIIGYPSSSSKSFANPPSLLPTLTKECILGPSAGTFVGTFLLLVEVPATSSPIARTTSFSKHFCFLFFVTVGSITRGSYLENHRPPIFKYSLQVMRGVQETSYQEVGDLLLHFLEF